MPPCSKRKFNSYQEPSGIMRNQPAIRGVPSLQRPVPTPETQEIYNKMRHEEERLTPESLSQVQNGSAGFLQLPSPSQCSASSPSPSYASTTYSISQAMDDMGVDDQPRAKKQKAKSGRQGPLPEAKKLRAALMRKLRACDDCRVRKVRCSHFNFALFEAEYQAAKRAPAQPATANFHTAHAVPYQPGLGDSHDLLGVGVGQNLIEPLPSPPFHGGIQGGRNEAYADPDPLSDQQTTVQPHVTNVLSLFEGARPRAFNSSSQYPRFTAPQDLRDVPIGKQVRPYSMEWVCLYGHQEYPSGANGRLESCGQQFSDVGALKRHFSTVHAPFDQEWYTWYCIKCQLSLSLQPDAGYLCPQCNIKEPFTWQTWCWGKVSISSRSASLPLGRVTAQDGSPSNRSSWTSPSGQFTGQSGGYNNVWMAQYGAGGYGYGNGNGTGGGQNYTAAPAPLSKDMIPSTSCAKFSTTCCDKNNPAACDQSGTALVTNIWCHPKSTLYPLTQTTAGKTPSLKHACPAAIVLAVFVIALIDSCVSGAGRSSGVDSIVSAILGYAFPDGRASVPELSMACVVVGLVTSWVFRHVRSKLSLREQDEGVYGRGVDDGSFSVQGDVSRSVGVATS